MKISISQIRKGISKSNLLGERFYLIKISENNTLIKKEGSLNGAVILKSGITDFDGDGNVEIFIISSGAGSGSYGEFIFYELIGYELIRHELPKLDLKVKHFYMGHDNFEVTNKNIIRSFPAYNDGDANCCPTGGDVILKYNYVNSNIIETGYSINVNKKSKDIVTITIKSAINLPSMDRMSQSDSWLAIFKANELIGQTKVIKNNNSPIYNNTFSFERNPQRDITIKVYDQDLTKNELIGTVVLQKYISGTYPILDENSNGSIKQYGELEVEFK